MKRIYFSILFCCALSTQWYAITKETKAVGKNKQSAQSKKTGFEKVREAKHRLSEVFHTIETEEEELVAKEGIFGEIEELAEAAL